MNREEYLKRLSYLLRDLPEEEIEDAISYYEDYKQMSRKETKKDRGEKQYSGWHMKGNTTRMHQGGSVWILEVEML